MPNEIIITRPVTAVIKIATGPPGPKGDSGGAGTAIEISQGAPATTWTIVHNMGKRPAGWTIYDSADTIYEGGAEYIDDNTMRFTFSAAISGRVVLI